MSYSPSTASVSSPSSVGEIKASYGALPAPPRPGTPWVLPEATAFHTTRRELNAEALIETLKSHPQLMKPLTEAAEAMESRLGRRRVEGRWALAYVAFVISPYVDVKPWYDDLAASVWKAAEFREPPAYPTVHRRFAELEACAEAFEEVAGVLIGRAQAHTGGKVGANIHIDSTEAQTNVRLHHACGDSDSCRRRKSGAGPAVLSMKGDDPLRQERHAGDQGPEPEDIHSEQLGDADSTAVTDSGQIVTVNGCKYWIRDRDAGCRAYTGKDGSLDRFWTGLYNTKLTDRYTGAPLAIHLSPANRHEAHSYPDAFARLVAITGKLPSAVIADRGYSVSSVFEHNTRLGVASVFPWRASGKRTDQATEDTDRYDRDGVPRCRHCGGPGRAVRFERESNSGPRLHYKCAHPIRGQDCAKTQTIACKENWRLLVPLWANSEAYGLLAHGQHPIERVQAHYRNRYKVAADSHHIRPRRIGMAWQQLRASAAVMVEWLKICIREGWLASARPFKRSPGKPKRVKLAKDKHADKLKERRDAGLDFPYGQAAVRLGIGELKPTRGSRGPAPPGP